MGILGSQERKRNHISCTTWRQAEEVVDPKKNLKEALQWGDEDYHPGWELESPRLQHVNFQRRQGGLKHLSALTNSQVTLN